MSTGPGTVSKILWHFTGGPLWDSAKNHQCTTLKPASDAYKAFTGILGSKQIRLGGYRELVNIQIHRSEKRGDDPESLYLTPHVESLMSDPVCCLAEIPISHLSHHSSRYGNMAIGFHREKVVRTRHFAPVHYRLQGQVDMQWLWHAVDNLKKADKLAVSDTIERMRSQLPLLSTQIADADSGALALLDELEGQLTLLKYHHGFARTALYETLCWIKSFTEDEFTDIYAEREWRSNRAYDFACNHLAMLVLPREREGVRYFDDFVAVSSEEPFSIPRSVPIVPWEDLIEH